MTAEARSASYIIDEKHNAARRMKWEMRWQFKEGNYVVRSMGC